MIKTHIWKRAVGKTYAGSYRYLVLALAAIPATGCLMTYPEDIDPEQARVRVEIQNLRQDVEQLQNRLELVHDEHDRLERELERLRVSVNQERNQDLSRFREETDRRFERIDSQREADRNFVVEEVTKRIAGHLSASRERAAAAQQPTVRSEHGRYHEVRAGETLSEIAVAYGVTAAVIKRANDLDNPDRLRIGQRLFIPD